MHANSPTWWIGWNPDGLHEVSIMTFQNQRSFQIPQIQGKNPDHRDLSSKKKIKNNKKSPSKVQGHHLRLTRFCPQNPSFCEVGFGHCTIQFNAIPSRDSLWRLPSGAHMDLGWIRGTTRGHGEGFGFGPLLHLSATKGSCGELSWYSWRVTMWTVLRRSGSWWRWLRRSGRWWRWAHRSAGFGSRH